MKRIMIALLIIIGITGCGKKETIVAVPPSTSSRTFEELVENAKKEKKITSIGMMDDWANWGEQWVGIKNKYGIIHPQDKDMSSAEIISVLKASRENSPADMFEVGFEFAKVAVTEGLTQPYKPKNWDKIPSWAKDIDGNYALSYTGTIAFIVDKTLVKKVPTSWKELKESGARVSIGEVGRAAQSNAALLASAIANGGDETNLEPGFKYFADLAKKGKLASSSPNMGSIEKGEVEVGLVWDFNALSFRENIDEKRFAVLIPSDGSLISGYVTIITKNAKHPNAAKLVRDYIFSDEGQLNFAKGLARPIIDVTYTEEVAKRLLPKEQYKNVSPIKDFDAWSKSIPTLNEKWQEEVLSNKK